MKLPYFFIRAYLWISHVAEEIMTDLQRVCQYLRGYPRAHQWVYLHGQMLPLSHVRGGQEDASWTYSHHQLTRGAGPQLRMGWLSAKLVSDKGEYDMDGFLERLRIRGGIPSLHLIFLAWCAETGRWLAPDRVTLHVIDEDGQDCTYRTDETLYVRGRRLYVSRGAHTPPRLVGEEELRALFPSADPYTFYHA
jgi:hypothetical protein